MKVGMVVILLLILPVVYAATLQGDVYDIELNKIEKTVLTINTTPKQVTVAEKGHYKLEIPKGSYEIIAEERIKSETIAVVKEKIDIIDEKGVYELDFILLPGLNGEEELPEVDLDILQEAVPRQKPWLLWSGIALAVLGVFYLILKKLKIKKIIEQPKVEQIPDELDELLAFIRRQGGRVTQKDIRRHFPSSEAKISLMISELEAKGKIEKIKKGRGNIVKIK